MYIEPLNKAKRKDVLQQPQKADSDASNAEKEPDQQSSSQRFLEKYSKETLMHWQAPEFESLFKREKRWYMYLSLVLAAIVGYAVYTNSPLMAIVFILIGVLGYIYIEQEPRTLDFMITEDGMVAGKEMYLFENIESFWIFYEPGEMKVISLKNKSYLLPYVHIPINDQDPVVIREHLLKFIPEVKQDLNFIDALERFLGI